MRTSLVLASFLCIMNHALTGQDVISDSTYNDQDWIVFVDTAFGGSQLHMQMFDGGNPDSFRYMRDILPWPTGTEDLTQVAATHIYTDLYLALHPIASVDFAEDVRLLNLQWDEAWVVSYPAIRQGGKLFRATEGITVIGDTLWHSGSVTGLTANDFIALDGSSDKPDFSDSSGFLSFGFWRIHTRSQTLPPIPPDEDLVYIHGSDNFTVTIHETTPNRRPEARDDEYLYLDYVGDYLATFSVLANDTDPDGDSIWIIDADGGFGNIVGFDHASLTYAPPDNPIWDSLDQDFFTYDITDGELEESALVRVYFCYCPIQCIALYLAPPPVPDPVQHHDPGWMKFLSRSPLADSLDLPLFRRFRDEVLLPTHAGAGLVDVYYNHAPEVIPLLVFVRPDIGLQAYRTLQMMQPMIDNLINGDSTAIVTQQLVDSVGVLIDSLIAHASDSLRLDLQEKLDSLCPMQDLVGLSVGDAVDAIVCDTMGTAIPYLNTGNIILKQNYPNPFSNSASSGKAYTTIPYYLPKPGHITLDLYNIYGQKLITLAADRYNSGEQQIVWNGRDQFGHPLPPGVYFYQLSFGTFRATRQMVITR